MPLVGAEPFSGRMQALADRDPHMLVWWASEVECVWALTRQERCGALDPDAAQTAIELLMQLADRWDEVEPGEAVREAAKRFLRVHPLRAADALQLAAAVVAANRRPASLELVTLDERLAEAARKEGFVLAGPARA